MCGEREKRIKNFTCLCVCFLFGSGNCTRDALLSINPFGVIIKLSVLRHQKKTPHVSFFFKSVWRISFHTKFPQWNNQFIFPIRKHERFFHKRKMKNFFKPFFFLAHCIHSLDMSVRICLRTKTVFFIN